MSNRLFSHVRKKKETKKEIKKEKRKKEKKKERKNYKMKMMMMMDFTTRSVNTFTAIVDLSRFNNSCLKSPA